METVAFITCEAGDDLLVSFAIQDPEDLEGIESLTLLRTPKYEFILPEEERGVHVSFDRYDDDADDYLEEVFYDERSAEVRIKTTIRRYEVDVRKVDAAELKQMKAVLRKMNLDGKLKLTGI